MLLKFLGKHRDTGLLIMRIGLGIGLIIHGLPKLVGGTAEWARLGASMSHLGINFFPVFWGFLIAVTEGIGGVLLIIGAFYRPVCLLLTFAMIVATARQMGDPKGSYARSQPLQMAFTFFGLAFVGPGRFSIDKD